MELNYSLTRDDHLTYQLFAASKSKTEKWKRTRNLLFVPMLYAVTGIILAVVNAGISYVAVFIFLSALWFILYPVYSRYHYRFYYEKFVDEHFKHRINRGGTIILDKEFFMMKDDYSEARINYQEIQEIYEIGSHFFIILKNGHSIIFPKHRMELNKLEEFIIELSFHTNIEVQRMTEWKWS